MTEQITGLIVKGETTMVALKKVEIASEIKDVAAMTTITQYYENEEQVNIEAVYCFPVEESAAVCGFEIETDGRRIIGKTEEKEQAFETYDKAIEEGDAGFLLDQENEDVLNIYIGNIEPKQQVKISITYVAESKIVDGTIRYQVPTTVSPRYAPADSDPAFADRISPPYTLSAPYTLSLSVRMLEEYVKSVNSPSHAIHSVRENGSLLVSLSEETMLDRDFILELEIREKYEPVCLLGTHANGENALLFRFIPELDEAAASSAVRKSEVLFILDCSGSMSGSSIASAKEALELSLRSLSEGDRFNIIRFGSEYEMFSNEPVVYGKRTFDRALHYLKRTDANMGGTELKAPMEYACGLAAPAEFQRDVILITDGEVSYPDDIIRTVGNAKDRLRVFSFGIGHGASHHLVKGVARASGGEAEMIMPGEKILPKILRQFSRLSQPALKKLRFEAEGTEVELSGSLPPIYEGDSFTAYGRVHSIDDGASVTLHAELAGSPCSWKADIISIGHDRAIPSLWARTRIKEIKFGGTSNQTGSGSNRPESFRHAQDSREQIIDLGLRFNLLTDFTSFVAVEERSAEEKTEGAPEFRRIPVMLTRDWHGIESAGISALPEAEPPEAYEDAMAYPAPSSAVLKSSRNSGALSGMSNLLSSAGEGIADGIRNLRESKKVRKPKGRVPSASIEQTEPGGVQDSPAGQDADWYLAVLGSQQVEGYFDCTAIVMKKTGLNEKDLEGLAIRIDGTDKTTGLQILVTWLAVYLLEQDTDAEELSGRAVQKARTWITKQVPAVTVDGEDIENYLKKNYRL